MADLLHISPRTLRRRLEQDGKTYQQLVVDFRMAMARQYLAETKLPVNEIADLIGYSNPANFYRTFRQIEQMTPQNYRSQYR
jgi:AraC-like DNA-binding protein